METHCLTELALIDPPRNGTNISTIPGMQRASIVCSYTVDADESRSYALTITVADQIYQQASVKAAAVKTPLPEIVRDLVTDWAAEKQDATEEGAALHRQAELLKFLDEVAARPLKPGPSVGPLNREELYRRGVSGY